MNWRQLFVKGEKRFSLYCGRYYAQIQPTQWYILKRYRLDFYKCIYIEDYDCNIELIKILIEDLIQEDIEKIMNPSRTIFFSPS